MLEIRFHYKGVALFCFLVSARKWRPALRLWTWLQTQHPRPCLTTPTRARCVPPTPPNGRPQRFTWSPKPFSTADVGVSPGGMDSFFLPCKSLNCRDSLMIITHPQSHTPKTLTFFWRGTSRQALASGSWEEKVHNSPWASSKHFWSLV